MKSIFRIFFGAEGTRPSVVLLCLLLAGLAEAVGLTTMLPVVTQLMTGSAKSSSPLNTYVLDTLSSFGIPPTIEMLMLIVVIGMILKAVLSFAAISYVGYAVANVAAGLRMRLIGQLMNARWAYFTNQKVGQIANSISTDSTRAGKAYLSAAKFVAFCVQGVVYICVAVALSWKLALIGLVIGGFITVTLNFLVRMSRRAGRKQTVRTSELVTFLTDTLNNIKPLKAMSRQAVFVRLMADKIKALKKALRRQVIAAQGRIYLEEIFLIVCMTLGVYVAAIMWSIPIEEIAIMGIIFFQVVSNVGRMQKNLQLAVEVESAYWAVMDLIDDTGNQLESSPGTAVPSLRSGCRFEAVEFAYGDHNVVREVSFEIPAHGITVLKGPSGSGKTTIVDLLVGLHRPRSGNIYIDNVPLERIDLHLWRSRIGYVPQDPSLFHDTIRANITLGDPSCTDEDVQRAIEAAGAAAFVNALPDGADTVVGERGAKFSGGQRQRLALARALVKQPDLLILDEVTSALDPDSEREICRNIESLSDQYTILVITHRPAWIDIATRLYQVDAGRMTPVPLPVKAQAMA